MCKALEADLIDALMVHSARLPQHRPHHARKPRRNWRKSMLHKRKMLQKS